MAILKTGLRTGFYIVCFSIGCAHSPDSALKIRFCPPIKSMPPRISEPCETALNNEAKYQQRLSNSLFARKVLADDLKLIFSYSEGPAVESVCIASYSKKRIESKMASTIRRMSRIDPPSRLSCLANHHAEIRFTTEFSDETTRRVVEEYMDQP